LELVQLPGYEKRRVDELSGGQQQRVASPAPLPSNPPCYSSTSRFRISDVTSARSNARVARAGYAPWLDCGLRYTTIRKEAFALCDRISVMAGGRILQTGKPRDLTNIPRSYP